MTAERWQGFSLVDQIAHIGSEISRARAWQERSDQESFQRALERALALIDLTIGGCQSPRLKELTRLREVVSDHYCSAGQYTDNLTVLEDYCNAFALMPRRHDPS